MNVRMLWLLAVPGCLETGETEPVPVAEPAPEVKPVDPRVTKAAAVANAIASGTNAEEAMAAEGLDARAFRALLYEIAGDAELSAAYEAARK